MERYPRSLLGSTAFIAPLSEGASLGKKTRRERAVELYGSDGGRGFRVLAVVQPHRLRHGKGDRGTMSFGDSSALSSDALQTPTYPHLTSPELAWLPSLLYGFRKSQMRCSFTVELAYNEAHAFQLPKPHPRAWGFKI